MIGSKLVPVSISFLVSGYPGLKILGPKFDWVTKLGPNLIGCRRLFQARGHWPNHVGRVGTKYDWIPEVGRFLLVHESTR